MQLATGNNSGACPRQHAFSQHMLYRCIKCLPAKSLLIAAICLLEAGASTQQLAATPGIAPKPHTVRAWTGVITEFHARRRMLTLTDWSCGKPANFSGVLLSFQARSFSIPARLKALRHPPASKWQVVASRGGRLWLRDGPYRVGLHRLLHLGFGLRVFYLPALIKGRLVNGIYRLWLLDPKAGLHTLKAELLGYSHADGRLLFLRKNHRRWGGYLYPGFYAFVEGRLQPLAARDLHTYRPYKIYYHDEACGEPVRKLHEIEWLSKKVSLPPLVVPPRPRLSRRPHLPQRH